MTQPKCICDLCDNGINKAKLCYAGGVETCVKNGVYTLFTQRYPKPEQSIQQKDRFIVICPKCKSPDVDVTANAYNVGWDMCVPAADIEYECNKCGYKYE